MISLSAPAAVSGVLAYNGTYWARSTTALFTLVLDRSVSTNISVASLTPGGDPDLAIYRTLPSSATDPLGIQLFTSSNVGMDALILSHDPSYAPHGAAGTQYTLTAAVLWTSPTPATGTFLLRLAALRSPSPSPSTSPSPSRSPSPSQSLRPPLAIAVSSSSSSSSRSSGSTGPLSTGAVVGLAFGVALALALLVHFCRRLYLYLRQRCEEMDSTMSVVVVQSAPERELPPALNTLRPYASSNVGNPMRRAAKASSTAEPPPEAEPALP